MTPSASHLFDLARRPMRLRGHVAGPLRRSAAQRPARPRRHAGAPAWVHNDRLDFLAANRLGYALYSELFTDPVRPANSARFMFLNPRSHDFYPDWEQIADNTVAILRGAAGRNPYDEKLSKLIGELSTRSEDFRTRWAAHNVRLHRTGVKHLHHPVVGDLELTYEAMELPCRPWADVVRLHRRAGDAVRRRPQAPCQLGRNPGARRRCHVGGTNQSTDSLKRSQQRKELSRRIIGAGAPFQGASRYRVAQVDRGRIVHTGPVGHDRPLDDLPCVIALLVLVEIAPADDDVDISISCAERVCRDGVDLALGDVAADGEVHGGDVVLHRPDVRAGGGERAEEVVDAPRRELAVGVDGVVVVELPQLREIAAIDGAAVGVHQLPQRKLVEHFLQQGLSRRHFRSVAGYICESSSRLR